MRATTALKLHRLANMADLIAVHGDNRYVDGQYVPTSAQVMHDMRDAIRSALEEEHQNV